jgi:NADP-dependent 3-hydroxy acid dehydrogenase YdfG
MDNAIAVKQRVALVTGASSGIDYATAIAASVKMTNLMSDVFGVYHERVQV